MQQFNIVKKLVFTIALSVLAGCGGVDYTIIGTDTSSGGNQEGRSGEIVYPDSTPTPRPTPAPDTSSPQSSEDRPVSNQPAIQQLLTQARSAKAAGNFQSAAVTLEQALTIDNRNAELWLELALVRQAMGQRSQAINLAKRARQYGQGSIKRQAQQLIDRLS